MQTLSIQSKHCSNILSGKTFPPQKEPHNTTPIVIKEVNKEKNFHDQYSFKSTENRALKDMKKPQSSPQESLDGGTYFGEYLSFTTLPSY